MTTQEQIALEVLKTYAENEFCIQVKPIIAAYLAKRKAVIDALPAGIPKIEHQFLNNAETAAFDAICAICNCPK